MPKGKPRNIEVVDDAGGRFVVETYADGEVVRKNQNEVPRRKPRKPFARARIPSLDSTRERQL